MSTETQPVTEEEITKKPLPVPILPTSVKEEQKQVEEKLGSLFGETSVLPKGGE